MAIGDRDDFQIYDEEFYGGVVETLEQETNAFNGASNGAISLVPRIMQGDFEKESFVKSIASLVARRDPSVTTSVTDTAMTEGELVGVKLARRIGPIAQTKDAFRKKAQDPSLFSFLLGQQIGKAMAADYLNTVLRGIRACISGQTALVSDVVDVDGSGGSGITHGGLNTTIAKLGDAGSRIAAFVMHSDAYYSLVGQSITDKITNVADIAIHEGTPATFGRPVIVTDSSVLGVAAGTAFDSVGVTADTPSAGQAQLAATGIGAELTPGDHVTLTGFTNAANNHTFIVAAVVDDDTVNVLEGGQTTVTEAGDAGNTATRDDANLVLGLVEGAAEVAESEEREIYSETVTGLENLVVRIQGEHSFNVRVRGFAWGSTANPLDNALQTSANWSLVASDTKSGPGVMLACNQG